jgi:GNAT superfamily N-acetyltransferase
MEPFTIVVGKDQREPRLDEVRGMLRAHNHENNALFMQELETYPAVPLIVLGFTADGSVAGGLIGESRGRWLRVNIMAVRRDCRRKGLGRQILTAAESEAISRACDRAFLETMDYQGPAFYESSGYARRCELADWDSHGHAKYIYTKALGAPQQPERDDRAR